jgi:hypothetical protein
LRGNGRRITTLRPAWATYQVQDQPQLYRETLPQKKKKELSLRVLAVGYEERDYVSFFVTPFKKILLLHILILIGFIQ